MMNHTEWGLLGNGAKWMPCPVQPFAKHSETITLPYAVGNHDHPGISPEPGSVTNRSQHQQRSGCIPTRCRQLKDIPLRHIVRSTRTKELKPGKSHKVDGSTDRRKTQPLWECAKVAQSF